MPRVLRWEIPCALKGRQRFDLFAGEEGSLPVPLQGTDPGVAQPRASVAGSLSPGLESWSPLGTQPGPRRPNGPEDQSPGLRESDDRCPGCCMGNPMRPEGAPEIRFVFGGRREPSGAPSGHGSGRGTTQDIGRRLPQPWAGIPVAVGDTARPHRPNGPEDQSPGLRKSDDRCPG